MHRNHRFVLMALVLQAALIACYATMAEYANVDITTPKLLHEGYAHLQQMQMITVAAFGLLMAFLKRHAYGGLVFTLMTVALVLQVNIILEKLFRDGLNVPIRIEMPDFVRANFATMTVLVSYGALLGKVGPNQLLIMALFETATYVGNRIINMKHIGALDPGSSMFTHIFGALFGLAASKALHRDFQVQHPDKEASYLTHVFAMVGSLFLWLGFPAINSASSTDPYDAYRAVVNTYLALCGGTLAALLTSSLVDTRGRFRMAHVENAGAAGGIAIGSVAPFAIQPAISISIGVIGGVVAVITLHFITPTIDARLKMTDTRGVFGAHALPGLVSAIACWFLFFLLFKHGKRYTAAFVVLANAHGTGNETEQAWRQIAALGTTAAMAIVAGAVTGLIIRLVPGVFEQLEDDIVYSDEPAFHTPDDFFKSDYHKEIGEG